MGSTAAGRPEERIRQGNTQYEQQGEMRLKKSIQQNPKDVCTLTKGLSFLFPELWKENIKRAGLTKPYKK